MKGAMNPMKKRCLLVLSGALILGLTACGGNPEGSSSESTEPSSSSVAGTSSTPTESSPDVPSSEEPSSEAPSSEEPSSKEPSSEEPSSEEPSSEEPSSSEEPIPSSSDEPTPSSSEEPTPSSSEEPTPSSSDEPTTSSSEEPTPSSSEEPVIYSIAVSENVDPGISVDVAASAQEGDYVAFVVTYDATVLKVTGVTYNGKKAGQAGVDTYYFYMPAGNVTIDVSSEPIVSTYAISNGNADAVVLSVASKAAAGETVTFSYSINPGYTASDAPRVVLDPIGFEEETVDVTPNDDGTYSFTMPAQAVIIKVPTSYGVYGIAEQDDDDVIYTIKASSDNSSPNNGYVAYKDTVTVTLTQTEYKKGVGIKVPELYGDKVLTPEEGSKTVSFPMPYYDVTVVSVSADFLRSYEIVNSDHLTLSVYSKDAEGNYVLNEENGAVYGSTVYVKAASTDAATYVVDAISFVYYGYSGKVSSTTTIDVTKSLNDDGYYYFTMPKVYEDTVATLTVTELDNTKYAGKSFVGSYMSAELYNNRTGWNSSYKVTVAPSGKFTCGSNSYNITSIDEDAQIGVLGEDGSFMYGGNWIIGRYNFDSSSIFSTDMSLSIKKESDADDDSLYTIHYQFIGSARNYAAAEVYRDGTFYDALFLNIKDKAAYLEGVTFEKLDGTQYVDDALASYNVKVGEKVVAKVRTQGTEGGYANRSVVDDVYGSYALTQGGEATLVLDGEGGATYNGSTGTYTYEGTTVTVTIGKSVYTIVVNVDDGTYSVTSSKVYQPINGLDQKTYKTSSSGFASSDGDTYQLIVSFDGKNCLVQCPLSYTTTSGYFGYVTDKYSEQTYELDTTGMTVTCNFYMQSRDTTMTSITFTVSDDYTTLTATTDVSYFYKTTGAVLTVVA